jgi:CTD small phosphatase-like protein 2
MGEVNDRALKDLLPLLVEIVLKKCKDVRIGLKLFREQMI